MSFGALSIRSIAALGLVTAFAGCGGGAGSGPPPGPVPITLPTGANVAPILVDAGIGGLAVNIPTVSVKVCVPGTASCQTIDHILLDTGSTGLRILSTVLSSSVKLPALNSTAGDPLYECLTFADGYSWGSAHSADIQIANGQAHNIAVQIIGDHSTDPSIPITPTDCSEIGAAFPPRAENTVASFGANGVLGVSVFQQDCGPACVTVANPGNLGFYYGCPANGCVGVTISLAAQLQNPVSQLIGSDHNGVLIVLPDVGAAGQATVTGALALGIDTESNNALGSPAVLKVNSFGNFTTLYKGRTLGASYIDSGSYGYIFPDSSLTVCATFSNFYCPATAQSLSATNQSSNGTVSTVPFRVVNAESLLNTNGSFTAYNDLGGPVAVSGTQISDTFDWGLPFFYGRKVYVAFEGQTTSTGSGPFLAY